MDGEAHELETRRILDEIGKDDELRAAWDRFHLARSAMAGDPLDTRHGEDAIERLWEAVDAGAGEESAGTVEAVSRRRPFGLRTGAASSVSRRRRCSPSGCTRCRVPGANSCR